MEDTQAAVGYNFYFVCLTASETRRALPAIEEKNWGRVLHGDSERLWGIEVEFVALLV